MSLKAKIEAIIYAAEEPVTLAQLLTLLTPDLEEVLAEQDAVQPELPIEDALDEAAGDTPSIRGNDLPPAAEAAVAENAPEASETAPNDAENVSETPENEPLLVDEKKLAQQRERRLRDLLKAEITALMEQYEDRGVYISEVASGYRMSTKPEYHDLIRDFAKSLKPALKLSLPALETLAVIAYKQPVTAAEVGEIRGVDSGGVLGGLMSRKLITTAGRKQVIGRPILYKTTKEFLLRFGLKDVNELPSIEEFEKMAGELAEQEDLEMQPNFNTDVVPAEPEITENPDVTPSSEEEPEEAPATPEPEPQADGAGDSVDQPVEPENPASDVEAGAPDAEEREAAAGIENE